MYTQESILSCLFDRYFTYFYMFLINSNSQLMNGTDKPHHSDEIDDLLKKIGNKIRLIRKSKYKNYEDFALINGLNKVTVFKIEKGGNSNIRSILEVLFALKISPKDFFSDFD